MTTHSAYCNAVKSLNMTLLFISNGSRKSCFKLAVLLSILPLEKFLKSSQLSVLTLVLHAVLLDNNHRVGNFCCCQEKDEHMEGLG